MVLLNGRLFGSSVFWHSFHGLFQICESTKLQSAIYMFCGCIFEETFSNFVWILTLKDVQRFLLVSTYSVLCLQFTCSGDMYILPMVNGAWDANWSQSRKQSRMRRSLLVYIYCTYYIVTMLKPVKHIVLGFYHCESEYTTFLNMLISFTACRIYKYKMFCRLESLDENMSNIRINVKHSLNTIYVGSLQ